MDNRFTAALGICVSGGLGFVSMFPPPFVNALPETSKIVIGWVGVVLFCISVFALLFPRFFGSNLSLIALNKISRGKQISLREAAQKVYTKKRHSEFTKVAAVLNPGESQTLSYFGHLLLDKIPVFGKKPPSIEWDLIPDNDAKKLSLNDDSTALIDIWDKSVKWAELEVSVRDVKRFIKKYPKLINEDSELRKISPYGENLPKKLSASQFAKINYRGDESSVWAAIASGELKAIGLLESKTHKHREWPVKREWALAFMAGDEVVNVSVFLPHDPVMSSMGDRQVSISVSGGTNVDCTMRKKSVTVLHD